MREAMSLTGNLLLNATQQDAPALDVSVLESCKRRPQLFAPGVALFWDDPYISQSMLKSHLDPETPSASRRPEQIDAIVEWLAGKLGLAQGQRVVDLGCGPGLYARRLAARGLDVTGVDYSRNSIAYARQEAAAAGLPIKYILRDYRTLDYQAEYDAALLIYYDLGALSDADRDEVLRRVLAALRPGGRFAFDVLTEEGRARTRAESGWQARQGGFWRPGPHVVLTDVFTYPANHAELDQYIVIQNDGAYSIYRVWHRYYDRAEICEVVERAGFEVEGVWADLAGRPVAGSGDEGLAVIARKPG